MKERLQTLLTHENLTPVRFAELVEVQRSSVSHVLSGRNKPSLDFIGKILAAFPHVSPDWLIQGIGEYKRSARASQAVAGPMLEPSPLNSEKKPANIREEAPAAYGPGSLFEALPSEPAVGPEGLEKAPLAQAPVVPSAGKEPLEVVKMVFFYADHSFEVFYPGRE